MRHYYKRARHRDEAVSPLTPHAAEPEIGALGENGEIECPTVVVSLQACADIQSIIDCAGPDEIGWMGTVDKVGDRYIIDKIFLFKQDVSSGHCEFEQGDVGAFYAELLSKDSNRLLVNKIKFWGHLHPGDFVDSSWQDDQQMEIFGRDQFMLRGIFTRTGRAKFTLYDYKRNLVFADCPWSIQLPSNEERKKQIAAEIKLKVSTKKKAVFKSWFAGQDYEQ